MPASGEDLCGQATAFPGIVGATPRRPWTQRNMRFPRGANFGESTLPSPIFTSEVSDSATADEFRGARELKPLKESLDTGGAGWLT